MLTTRSLVFYGPLKLRNLVCVYVGVQTALVVSKLVCLSKIVCAAMDPGLDPDF